MRLKKVKNAKEMIMESIYYVNNPQENIGNWTKVFKNENPIYIEIGMGKGKFILEMAETFPNINFIGIEKYDSVMIKAVKTLADKNLHNLKLILLDAENIENVFNKEISRIYLNFSDPWPKSKHEKRRLTSENFLIAYDKIFLDQKEIYQKTDNLNFFEFSKKSFISYGYRIDFITYDLKNESNIFNVQTEYEERFVSKGIKINQINVSKD